MSGSTHRCHRCMSVIGDGQSCPECGYINGNNDINKNYLMPDTVLNQRYIVGNLLHFNSESAVYIAYDTNLESVIEVKEYMPYPIAKRNPDTQRIELDPENVDLYKELAKEFLNLNEGLSKLRTISSLKQIYDIFPENNTCYAIMEHIQGMNLNEYLLDNLGELTWEKASALFLPTIRHLEKLHELGFIHGGISPETIYVSDKGQMKIGGFSILSIRQQEGKILSEIYDGYAAPEQYSSEQSMGPWTDIYAIAATLYKSLTGTKPSDANSRGSVDNLLPPSSLNTTVPNHISVAVMSAMSLQFRLRTQTMNDLYTDLSTAPRQQLAFEEDDETEESEKPSSSKRYVFIAMGITAAILVLVSAIILWFLYGPGNNNEESAELDLPSANITSMIDSSLNYTVSYDENSDSSESTNNVLLMYDLINKNINVVQTDSHYSSINVTIENEEYNEDYAEGLIYYQSIEANKEITVGQAVSVKVSKGSAYKTVPEFYEKNIDLYLQALQDAGIVNYEIRYVEDIYQEDDMVVGTSVQPNNTIHVDSIISIDVVKNY